MTKIRRREKYERNPLLDEPLVGPLEAARLWGYRSGRTFKRKLPALRRIGRIRTINKLKGTYYALFDVMKVRYPHASDKEVAAKLREYQEQKIAARVRESAKSTTHD